MSVRAYKITKYAEEDSFNLWHDTFFMELFEEVIGFENLNEGCGSFEITSEHLAEMKELFQKRKDKFNKDEQERTKEIFINIEEDFDNGGYASYLAF